MRARDVLNDTGATPYHARGAAKRHWGNLLRHLLDSASLAAALLTRKATLQRPASPQRTPTTPRAADPLARGVRARAQPEARAELIRLATCPMPAPKLATTLLLGRGQALRVWQRIEGFGERMRVRRLSKKTASLVARVLACAGYGSSRRSSYLQVRSLVDQPWTGEQACPHYAAPTQPGAVLQEFAAEPAPPSCSALAGSGFDSHAESSYRRAGGEYESGYWSYVLWTVAERRSSLSRSGSPDVTLKT